MTMVAQRSNPADAALEASSRIQFGIADILRRLQGDAFGAIGLGPNESPYQLIASGPFWRLRDYTKHEATQSLLIVAAPIKRPYIWDLAATASAIRYCLGQTLRVCLLEWLPASPAAGNNGIKEYTEAIGTCVEKISGESVGVKPFLIGHSLGGTLAAMFGARAPDSIRGLVLLGAPLCFQPATYRFRDALVALVPSDLSETEPCPGSLLSHMSALASPDTFIWSRLTDAALSVSDGHAMEILARVERWALDEVPLPGKLVHQLVEWLYRENLFCQGTLKDWRHRDRSTEPVGAHARSCQYDGRCGSSRLGQAIYGRNVDQRCSHRRISGRGRRRLAAPRDPDRTSGARSGMAGHYLMDRFAPLKRGIKHRTLRSVLCRLAQRCTGHGRLPALGDGASSSRDAAKPLTHVKAIVASDVVWNAHYPMGIATKLVVSPRFMRIRIARFD